MDADDATNKAVSSLCCCQEVRVGDQQEGSCSALQRSKLSGEKISNMSLTGGCGDMGSQDQYKGVGFTRRRALIYVLS